MDNIDLITLFNHRITNIINYSSWIGVLELKLMSVAHTKLTIIYPIYE
jgi:hypothetical protein